MSDSFGEFGGLNDVTEKIIGSAFNVSNSLGVGFLEKVYENALVHELRKTGLLVEQQKGIEVVYDGIVVGNYVADLLINDTVLIELKAIKSLEDIHFAQCLNYLTATNMRICLLLNFGTQKIQIKRIVR